MESIIHVELKSTNENTHRYYGSIKAIYTELSKDDIGVSYDSLVRRGFLSNPERFENSFCIIRKGSIVRTSKNA